MLASLEPHGGQISWKRVPHPETYIAGALDVGLHRLAYNGRDDKLSRAAIMESGNPVNVNVFNGTDFYQPLYDAIVNQTGCAGQFDTLQCLRTVPFGRLNNVFNATPFDSGFAPVVDGDFIQRYGSLQCSDGDFVCVPIISGANTDEGVSFGPVGINDAAGFHHYLERGIFDFLPNPFR